MAFMTWTDRYSIGVEEVDKQHQHLFKLLNRMYDSVVTGAEQSILNEVLTELIDYTVYHFSCEERLFKEHDYPGYDIQKKQHDVLTKQVFELQTEFREGSATISHEVLNFLNDWLVHHIVGSDLKFAKYLNSKKY